ncbi:GNAT family N-acetyltransferase [Thioalkalivibrio sp. HK1]|uniref:GNAT family N-acetyltransferase n=1 Tax=Thioalkalivibrio sp. HK1 TaxID=1469245 RepID=UPI00046E7B06|nr:GNAT family N-acetyltransferase [Thioalkalivibrio sp. HK1]
MRNSIDQSVIDVPLSGDSLADASPREESGSLAVTITWLEMLDPLKRIPPVRKSESRCDTEFMSLLAFNPPLSFYRYLYNTVGAKWHWYERRRLADEVLEAIIHDPLVEILVAYSGGVPAGYAELDCRRSKEVEIAYFGLIPEFIGKGIGPSLLDRAIRSAFAGNDRRQKPERVWLHTCTLDHPAALSVYRRAGFSICGRKETLVDKRLLDTPP